MHERKVEMAQRSCGFIGLPGGYGTFEEVFEVTTWTQLGIHSKRVYPKFLASFAQLANSVCSRRPCERSRILQSGPVPHPIRNRRRIHSACGHKSGQVRRWSF